MASRLTPKNRPRKKLDCELATRGIPLEAVQNRCHFLIAISCDQSSWLSHQVRVGQVRRSIYLCFSYRIYECVKVGGAEPSGFATSSAQDVSRRANEGAYLFRVTGPYQ